MLIIIRCRYLVPLSYYQLDQSSKIITATIKIIKFSIMKQRRNWTLEEDQKLRKIVANHSNEQLMNWIQIAEQFNKLVEFQRTGKQCRQRYKFLKYQMAQPAESSDPHIEGLELSLIKSLFEMQNKMGNKWAEMAQFLPGRSDNSIKNMFYSTLRKALRKVNAYVNSHRKRKQYKNIKKFQDCVLSKLVAVCQGNHEGKMIIKNKQILKISQELKKLLVNIERDKQTVSSGQENAAIQQAVLVILEFNRNCRRKKGSLKKKQSQQQLQLQRNISQQAFQSKSEKNQVIRQQSQEDYELVATKKQKKRGRPAKSQISQKIVKQCQDQGLVPQVKFAQPLSFTKKMRIIDQKPLQKSLQLPKTCIWSQYSDNFRSQQIVHVSNSQDIHMDLNLFKNQSNILTNPTPAPYNLRSASKWELQSHEFNSQKKKQSQLANLLVQSSQYSKSNTFLSCRNFPQFAKKQSRQSYQGNLFMPQLWQEDPQEKILLMNSKKNSNFFSNFMSSSFDFQSQLPLMTRNMSRKMQSTISKAGANYT